MDVRVGLESVVSVLPEKVLTAKDQSYLEPVIPGRVRGKFKFPKEVRRLRENDAAEILAEQAAKKALDHAGLKPSDIDFILSNNFGGKFVLPMLSSSIQHQLGMSQETPAVDVANGNASFVDSCEIAWNLVLSDRYQRVLVVNVSATETKGSLCRVDLTDPMSASMGDGASAAIVSSQNLKCEFLSYYDRTFSETYDHHAAVLRTPANQGLKGATDQPSTAVYMSCEPQFFGWWERYAERFGIDGINGALKKANLNLSELDIVISDQPLEWLITQWIDGAEKAGLRKDKWKHTWDQYGDLSSATIPVNLAELWAKRELKKNSVIAWLAFGAGGHAPTMVIKWLV
jgi:3-oxoacyl-[acyl-carrier-protein] synthase-3